MSVLIKHMAMPKGCIYVNDKDQTEYCPLLNHDDVPFCQYIETEPEIAIGIDERPVYCPLFDVPESCQDTVSRAAAIDALIRKMEPHNNGDGTITICIMSEGLVRETLNDLPSAEPEVIRCKDCKHRPKATRADENVFYGFSVEFPDEKCPCHCEDGWYGWYPDDDFYCGYAERRTDG